MTDKPKEYIYKSTLSKEYGLTPSMIRELGDPDEYVDNPYYRSGPEACLYRIDRVQAWVFANQWRLEKAKKSRANRSAASKKVHDDKRAERLREAREWIDQTKIICPTPLPATLLDDAQQSYRFSSKCADYRDQPALRAYVRHRLTNYEHLLWQVKRHEFGHDLYSLLRKRVDALVAEAILEWKPQGELTSVLLGPGGGAE